MLKSGWWRALVRLTVLGLVLFNSSAWLHARAMTHFVAEGPPITPLATMSLPEKVRILVMGVPVPRPNNNHTPPDVGLSYTIHRIDLRSAEWLEGWFVPHQQARGVVVLFHGYAMSKESLLPQAGIFHRLGFAVMLVDFRGSGGSTGTTTTLGLREAEDVVAATRYVERTWPNESLVLYGISMGATAIMRALATTDLQPDAVILESPFDRLLTTIRHRFEIMPVPSFPAAETLLFWGGIQQGFDGFQHNPVDYASAIACPALILYGRQDPWIRPEEVESVAARMGAQQEVVALPSRGHDVLVLAAPEPWTQSVAVFLDHWADNGHRARRWS